ncbi:translation initiation factor IF-2 N-terminal domain-containing protein [Mycolicibacterium sp. S2-37]|uniref:translation initiation factor IF-2 N-terminal domain-containing protein n=1 Tax=Mycolicibacterium sp. S2-37 TaxID=2810297 RepID=UPI001A94B3FE|nr:translation initiation factor IF-2 N-terminal domain-containing protein [Mycolicibacterium sp. S2-37]MBO0678180.1 translation initiation factor IF-2 N-terminal domain-containing protein [Mycolicibacterium sp. S2-37]
MADSEHTQAQDSTTQPQAREKRPERLRVHSLARVLGTTSRRVLDALAEFDGRTRSAHSTIDQSEADKVREALAIEATTTSEQPEVIAPIEAAEPEAVVEAPPEPTEEPESRLLLETPPAEPADYLPLFVAPQPVRREPPVVADDDDEDEDDAADAEDDDDQAERPAARRRRRGRRGRGRGRGEQNEDGDGENGDAQTDSGADTDQSSDDDDSDDDGADDDSSGGDGATRRRRRRRRRKSGTSDDSDSGSPDDPPNTVVHERPPREKGGKSADSGDGEIQGISGSTRLEAKRQRRRDGRDAGRRRPPILSEAEFLARREAVERVMVVRDKIRSEPPHEGARYTQIAVLEDGVVVEHFVTSAASASLVGNIYLGIVQNVLPSMEAAFVDIGRGRNGVLYAGEVNWEAAGLGGQNRKIEQALKPGDYVVVQVSKDPVGHKGARLTTQVSLAGRYLVYVPGASSTGISRKLPDTERQRLKEILREVVPADAGVIIRTASEGVKADDIRSDVNRLQERWTQIEAKAADITAKKAGAAVALYEEPDVLVKVIRDLFNEDFSGLIVSGDQAWDTINSYVESVAPDLLPRLTKYEPGGNAEGVDGPDVFAVHRIDEQLTKAMDRKVWLPSGGTLVIDRTEAMTVVDVNTGKFTGSGGNLEQTVTRNNLEAAEEIVRQLRLRDIGGIVVIDFIDMVLESNRDLVLRRLTEALARDRTRHQVSEVTSLGLVQLTRKKLGTGLIEAFSTQCPHCAGRGIVLHGDPVDNAAPNGRKSEPGNGGGSRRSRRGKKGAKPEEVPVAKVPPHPVGEHPMFKAMAAANGRPEDEDADEDEDDISDDDDTTSTDDADKVREVVGDELDDTDEDDSDEDASEDESDEDDDIDDEIDLDSDEEDDEDDDIEDIDSDDDDDDEVDSDDDDDDEDDSDEDDEDDDDDVEPQVMVAPARRPRRRAAARPAGPPSAE